MRIWYSNHGRCSVRIKDKNKQDILNLAQDIGQNLGIETPTIKECDSEYEVRFFRKKAKLIAWYLYKQGLLDLKQCEEDNIQRSKNNDDEFLVFIGAVKKGNRILPTVPARCSLEWCHIIQKQLSYKTQPIFSNKGQDKYYYLYIPQ